MHFVVSIIHDPAVTISFRRNASVWSVLCYGISPIRVPWISISEFFWSPFSFSPCFLVPLLWSSFFLLPIIYLLFPGQLIYFFASGVPLSLLSYSFSWGRALTAGGRGVAVFAGGLGTAVTAVRPRSRGVGLCRGGCGGGRGGGGIIWLDFWFLSHNDLWCVFEMLTQFIR